MRAFSLAVALALAASGGAALAEPPPGDPARGAALFDKVCAACHTIAAGGRRRVGPNLFGVVGARIAQKAGYPYTEAFRRSDIVWDEETLAEFLEAPSRVVPGTKMDWAMRDAQDIADVIAFMRGFRKAEPGR